MIETPFRYAYGADLLPGADDRGDGIWRWRRLLPLDGSGEYPLQVGGTPLLEPRRLQRASGLAGLVLKDETRTPTGSNKDRATALCAVDAVRRGAGGIVAASSGNVAVSLACGAAAVGLPAYLFVSRHSVSPHKVRLMRSFGATVFLVDAAYEVAYRLSEAAARQFGWYSRNTAENPLALQAKKTVAFEVWEQLGGRLPEVVYLPVGDGVTLAAFALGCQELIQCGVAERLPRLIGVQASGAAPLVRSFAEGRADWEPQATRTYADGIDVGDPAFGRQALAAVRDSGGELLAVTDEQLGEAIALLARTAGLLAEPAGVAALAGALAHRDAGATRDGLMLALISGTGFKDQRWLPADGGQVHDVAPSLDAVGTVLAGR